jgi:hypothetical protein
MKKSSEIRKALKDAGLTVHLSRRNGIRGKVAVTCSGIFGGQAVVFSGEGENDSEAWTAVVVEASRNGFLALTEPTL